MSALLFELCRLRKAETKHGHSAILDNIAYPKNRDISRRINIPTHYCAQYADMRDTVIFETALLIKSEHRNISKNSLRKRKTFFIPLSIADCNVYYCTVSVFIALPSAPLAARARSC